MVGREQLAACGLSAAEVARWAGLRERFKKGVHVKTAEGQVGVVLEDAKAEFAQLASGVVTMVESRERVCVKNFL